MKIDKFNATLNDQLDDANLKISDATDLALKGILDVLPVDLVHENNE